MDWSAFSRAGGVLQVAVSPVAQAKSPCPGVFTRRLAVRRSYLVAEQAADAVHGHTAGV